MSLLKNLSESERIQKANDRVLYANYLQNQIKFREGCIAISKNIQSGSGSSNQASLITNIRNGAVNTTEAERDRIILQSLCPTSSTNETPATNGSLLFNGTTSQLFYSGVTAGFQQFTFEGWFNTSKLTRQMLYGAKYTGSSTSGLSIYIVNSTNIYIDCLGVGSKAYTFPTMSINTWYHFAGCRDGSGNETMFLNGARSSTGVLGDTSNYTLSRYIGAWLPGSDGIISDYFEGYLAGFRIVIGSTVYNPQSSTITVPTQPLPNITNTVLLLNTPTGANYIKDTSSSGFTFTNTDVTSSTLAP